MPPRNFQQGFTLIELIVVITILGILAAYAIPKFINLQQDARVANANALAGSLRSASNLAHGKALTTGVTSGTIPWEGGTLTIASGYLTADAAGIVASIQDLTGFTTSLVSGAVTFTVNGAPVPTSCSATYTAPTGGSGVVPVITSTTSGC